jgi:gas vesicle protein
VQAPGGPVGLPAGLQGATVAQFDAARPVGDVGALETAATQAGRGFLDALLGSGAVLGGGLEAAGSVSGWNGLEDFGRDLGQSSSGTAAMEAASFLFGKATGGNKQGIDYADRAAHAIEEQERAWPMLTTVSRIGGGVALALASGGLSGASGGVGATVPGMLGMGAYEGAAGGMQEAYSKNESLRDVLVSGAVGAAFGAAAAGTVYGASRLPGKLASAAENTTLSRVFGDVKTAADDVADAVREAGGSEIYAAAKTVLKERAAVLKEIAAAGENPTLIRQAYDRASRAAGEKLSQAAGDFDAGSWATKTPNPVQKLLHRTPILDRVSEDLAVDAQRLVAARPSIDFELKVPRRLLFDADGTAAIGGLQGRVTQAIEQAPGEVRAALLPVSAELQQTGAAQSMALGHRLVQQFTELADSADDAVTASYARRQAQAIADELGSDAWGSAGKAYRAMTAQDSPLTGMDAKTLREALKHADSSRAVPNAVAEQNALLDAAYAARKQLGGQGADKSVSATMREVLERSEKAHAAVTFDGAPARRVLDVLSGAGRNIGESYASDILARGVGGMVGGVPGMLVARALSPMLGRVAEAAFGKGVSAAAKRVGRSVAGDATKGAIAWQQYTYRDKVAKLAQMVSAATPEVMEAQQRAVSSLPPDVHAQATTDMQAKLSQLMADIPKPKPNIRGKEWETLSVQDLRKAQAMYEATLEPMSVFEDFARGSVDYEKVKYAWKQYPGLQQAAQVGLLDVISAQLGDKDRERIPDGMLTQLDNLFGFDGALQSSLDRGFATRIDQISQPPPNNPPPSPGGKLQLPGSEPTFTQRLSGQQG